MRTKEKAINEYLELICSLLIDQFDVRYHHYTPEQFREEANERYCERDWVYKIGEYFKELAYYETRREGTGQGHHDICIPSKDFIIEVKYLRNWRDSNENKKNKTTWTEFQKDFEWLQEEIAGGKKSKRAYVLVWCNCIDYFGQVMQLGEGSGCAPCVNKDRIIYFPFLYNTVGLKNKLYARDYICNYDKTYPCDVNLNTIGKGNVEMQCLFLGNPDDKVHVAIYY